MVLKFREIYTILLNILHDCKNVRLYSRRIWSNDKASNSQYTCGKSLLKKQIEQMPCSLAQLAWNDWLIFGKKIHVVTKNKHRSFHVIQFVFCSLTSQLLDIETQSSSRHKKRETTQKSAADEIYVTVRFDPQHLPSSEVKVHLSPWQQARPPKARTVELSVLRLFSVRFCWEVPCFTGLRDDDNQLPVMESN